MLNIERVRALCALADHGSIAAVADALGVTPSGVSQQLAKLEKEVGTALIEREGRGVRLTDAGRLLARRGHEIISLLARAESEVAALHGDVVGALRLGAFVSASRAALPEAVTRLRAAHPHLAVTLAEGESETLIPQVMRRAMDVAVVDSWSTLPLHIPPDAVFTMLHRDIADVALPADHPLAQRECIPLAELDGLGWAAWNEGTDFHDWLVQTLRANGVDPRIDFKVAEFATHLEFVDRGLAAALIPRLAQVATPPGVRIVRTTPILYRDVLALSRADNDRPTVRAGVTALRSVFADLA
ncbi:LysR family transcriptional regulator [Tomitella biformata]|uniref:LysR family transcriptional regulator n=1 Tax=Tomitella biformata TaxID=630403 RepID=UPI000463CD52|nr:LysR family transcriptional regulator [Tomitella biformata]